MEDRNMTVTRRNTFLGVYGAGGFAQAIGAVNLIRMNFEFTFTYS